MGNAYIPANNSYTSIPSAQKSTALSWPLLSTTSGATYSGVPQNVHVFLPRGCSFLAKPKSTCKTRANVIRYRDAVSGRYYCVNWPILRSPDGLTTDFLALGPCRQRRCRVSNPMLPPRTPLRNTRRCRRNTFVPWAASILHRPSMPPLACIRIYRPYKSGKVCETMTVRIEKFRPYARPQRNGFSQHYIICIFYTIKYFILKTAFYFFTLDNKNHENLFIYRRRYISYQQFC